MKFLIFLRVKDNFMATEMGKSLGREVGRGDKTFSIGHFEFEVFILLPS